jgi:hypothetical protein
MNIIRTLTPATLVVALSLVALPAAAQGQGNNDRGRDRAQAGRQASRNASPRQNGARESAPPRQSATRDTAPRQGARQPAREASPRSFATRDSAPRDNGRPVAVPRGYSAPRYVAPRDMGRSRLDARPGYRSDYGYGGYGRRSVYIAPYRPHYFSQPYYTFRPRLSIGFGLWLGLSVPYPRAWVSDYPPPVYGYYQGSIRAVPGAAAYGGVSFDISPGDAGIWLDGEYVGAVSDFSPYAAPLTLVPGPHRIEVQADGYRPMAWDVNIVPGDVIPVRGAMQQF